MTWLIELSTGILRLPFHLCKLRYANGLVFVLMKAISISKRICILLQKSVPEVLSVNRLSYLETLENENYRELRVMTNGQPICEPPMSVVHRYRIGHIFQGVQISRMERKFTFANLFFANSLQEYY